MKRQIALTIAALMAFSAAPVYAEEYYEEEYYQDEYSGDEYYEGDYDYSDEYYGDEYAADPAYGTDMTAEYAELVAAFTNLEERVKILEEKYEALANGQAVPEESAAPEEPAEVPAEEPQGPSQDYEWTEGIPGIVLSGEYAFPEMGTDLMQYVLTFKNESEEDISFVCYASAKDAEGNVIANSSEEIVRISAGYEVPVSLSFSGLSFYDVIGINYAVAPYDADTVKPAQAFITCEAGGNGDTLDITMTAQEHTIIDAEAFIGIFLDDKMLLQDRVQFTSNGTELEPGVPVTQNYTIPAGVEYNRYRVFVTGIYQE